MWFLFVFCYLLFFFGGGERFLFSKSVPLLVNAQKKTPHGDLLSSKF